MTRTRTNDSSAARVPADAPILRAQGVGRQFRMGESDVVVLKNLDLSVRAGEFVAIEGRSGCGKSTLLHLLGALDRPSEGSIEFAGTNLAKLASAQRSRLRNTHFGFVFQFYHLLPELSVLENALLAPMIEMSWWTYRAARKQLQEKARATLVELGMEHRLKHKPAQLSGGERQRVAIARALLNAPKILFADEPTGNLDAETGLQIMGVLERLHREHAQTIILATHDRTLARRADRILVLRDGRLSAAEERTIATDGYR